MVRDADDVLRVAITLPYLYSVRDFLFTPVWDEMARREHVTFLLLNGDPAVGDEISRRGCQNIEFVKFPPQAPPRSQTGAAASRRLPLSAYERGRQFLRHLDRVYIFDSLVQRFAAVNGLSHYSIRAQRSPQERSRQQILSDYRRGATISRPLPESIAMFRSLYEIRHGPLNYVLRSDADFLRHLHADLFVFGRLHLLSTAYWARALRRLRVPMIGIVSSWDHPTTKGATPKGMSGYVVASERMVEEMVGLHGIEKAKVHQVGKVQMDQHANLGTFANREDFLARLGVPVTHKLVTFGTNARGLKEHEVSIAHRLAGDFIDGRYGRATLLLRTHPQDRDWERDFLSLAKPPHVICLSAASFGLRPAEALTNAADDQSVLANLMKHSDIVIQSRGSLALDAIALDTPVISLAFDGDLNRPPNDSFLLEYAFEHYKPIVAAQGTWMVGSYDALERAIRGYLDDRSLHSEGRRRILKEQIEPLDGKASLRLVDYLVDSAMQSRQGTIPQGDWNHTGLGDVTWASRQICRVEDYVDR